MKFRTTIELGGKTATGMRVPEEVVAELAAGKRPAVRVTLAGYTYRSTVMPYSGVFMLPLSAEHRTAAGVAAGDVVDVEIEVDSSPREVVVPEDLARALSEDEAIRSRFDGLSFSKRQAYVVSVESAKTPETRQRRIDKVLAGLAD